MSIKRILVACGTAIATATAVRVKLEELFRKNNMNVELAQCRVTEIGFFLKTKKYDLILSASFDSDAAREHNIPILNFVPILTGVGKEKLEKEIFDILKKS
ncbi:MAG: PTS galactitol transporter subunit IIB [Candidatus Bathyarchaeota archaeon]|nr:PTS galactitol transporter subunit IIB [Candidatus Bathyarchaeota archaeon]